MVARKCIPPGTIFNRLTYLYDVPVKQGPRRAMFRCECGVERIFHLGNVIHEKSKSCGCLKTELTVARFTRHGMTNTPTHKAWAHMLERCYNKNNKRYADYFGRGIHVCDRWRYSFENFLADMGEKPEGLTLDRINNDDSYYPGNCRWTTPSEQTSNTRRSIKIEVDGVRTNVVNLSKSFGVTYETMRIAVWKAVGRHSDGPYVHKKEIFRLSSSNLRRAIEANIR